MPDKQNLGSLFLAHAQGYVTDRALEERRVRIMQYLVANKYTISEKTARELYEELDLIADRLDE